MSGYRIDMAILHPKDSSGFVKRILKREIVKEATKA
jgi:hypothetical protein